MNEEKEEQTMASKKPEVTVVTTLTVTHVLRDCTLEEATGVAEIIADSAKQAAERGYADGHVLPQGAADDISIAQVQLFSMDRDGRRKAQKAREAQE